jgi:hypothetical protein
VIEGRPLEQRDKKLLEGRMEIDMKEEGSTETKKWHCRLKL